MEDKKSKEKAALSLRLETGTIGSALTQCTKAGIEPLWLKAGHNESGTQVGLLAIARCLPLREEGTHTLAFRGSDSRISVHADDSQVERQHAIANEAGSMPEIERLHPTAANLPFRPKPACRVAPKQPDGKTSLFLFRFYEAAVRDLTAPAKKEPSIEAKRR